MRNMDASPADDAALPARPEVSSHPVDVFGALLAAAYPQAALDDEALATMRAYYDATVPERAHEDTPPSHTGTQA